MEKPLLSDKETRGFFEIFYTVDLLQPAGERSARRAYRSWNTLFPGHEVFHNVMVGENRINGHYHNIRCNIK